MSGMAHQPVEMLTPADVARMFKVASKTASMWCRTGKLPATRTPGGHYRIRADVVAALLEHQATSRDEVRP